MEYRNGEYSEDARERVVSRSQRRKAITAFLAAIAAFGWLYFFFFSDSFVVQALEISGTQRLNRGEVERAVYAIADEQRKWPVRSRNLFALNERKLAYELKEQLYVEQVIVDKKYPNILRLKIEERQSSIIVTTAGSAYEVDRRGVVTREVAEAELSSALQQNDPSRRSPSSLLILSIASASGTPIEGDRFLTESQMSRWLDTFDTLKKRGFGYREATLEAVSSTRLNLTMHEGFRVYFDLLTPMDPQIESYYVFMDAKKADTRIYEYVDARIPGKIFFK